VARAFGTCEPLFHVPEARATLSTATEPTSIIVPAWRSHARVMIALFDQGIFSVATYLTGVLVSRATPVGFGFYTLVFTLLMFGGEAHNSLISTPQMLRLPHLRDEARRRFNGSLLVHQLVLSGTLVAVLLCASAVLYALSHSAGNAGLASYGLVSLVAAAVLGPLALRNFARNSCFAVRDATSALTLDLGVSVVQLGGVAILWAHGSLQWWLAVLIVAAANLFSSLLWFAMSRRNFAPQLRAAWDDFRSNWRMSRYIFLSSMLWVGGMYLYPWIISHYGGPAAVGVWGACFALANLGNPLVMGIQNWMGPAIAHAHADPDRDAAGFRAYVWRSSLIFVAIVLPACVVMALLAERLLVLLNGQAYAGNGRVTAILACTMFLQGFSFPTSRGLFSLGRAGLDMATNIGPLIVLGTLGAALVSHYGVMGAALSLLIAQAVGAASHVAAFVYASRNPSAHSPVIANPIAEVA
jgi:O-antigen/teichoic acid export membrane protein